MFFSSTVAAHRIVEKLLRFQLPTLAHWHSWPRPSLATRRGIRRQAHAGVTMMELLVVMVVAAILLALGVPSYRYVTYSNRVSSEVNALLGDLQYARSEAIKEGQTVTVCPVNVTPPTACATSSSWQTGWMVFSDINNNHILASTANILRVSAAFTGSPQDTFVANDNLTFVSFNREGFATALPTALSGTPTGYATITLHTTPNSAQWTRCIQIFTSGMMGTEKTNDPQNNCS